MTDSHPAMPRQRRRTALAVALAVLVALTTAATVPAAGATTSRSGTFAVSIDATNSPVTEGEALEVTASVENTGEETGTQTVSLRLGGRVVDSTDATLAPGEATTLTLAWETGDGDAGNYTAAVATANDTAERDVEVTEPSGTDGGNDPSPPHFATVLHATNSPVTEGDTLRVTAAVEDTGEGAGTQVVSLRVGGTDVNSTRLTLDRGENRTVTLSWATADGDAGNYTAAVASANDTVRRDVRVDAPTDGANDPPTVSVTVEPSAPTTGEGVQFTAEASDPDGTVESYEWTVDGEVVGTGPSLSYTFDEPGEHEVTLRVTDDDGAAATATTTVEVAAAGPPATATGEDSGLPSEVPGFGAVVAFAALVAGALVAARRRG